MLELKIIKLVNRLYCAIIRACLWSLNTKDALALYKLDESLDYADALYKKADRLIENANYTETAANAKYSVYSRDISAAYTVLENALDDAQIKE